MFVAPDMYIVFELYLKIELLFIPVARHHDASGHPARTGHAGLCVEAVGGGGAWPGHWPQGGWSTDLQLHQKDRNGKVSGKSEMFLFTHSYHYNIQGITWKYVNVYLKIFSNNCFHERVHVQYLKFFCNLRFFCLELFYWAVNKVYTFKC